MKPQHGIPSCTYPSHKFGTVCSTHCENGYSLNNMKFSVCQESGQWSDMLPNCTGEF